MHRDVVVGKQGAQRLARTADPAHHRSTRYIEHRRGFLITEPADIDDCQNVAMVNAEPLEGLADGKLVDDHGFERNRHEGGCERLVVKCIDLGLSAFGAQPIDPMVAHDGEHPSTERSLAIWRHRTGDCAHDRVLVQIGSSVHIASQRTRIGVETPRYRAQAVIEALPGTLHGHRDADRGGCMPRSYGNG